MFEYNPFRNLGLKVLAVLLASVLWLTVAGEHVVERTLRVPLELRNVPTELEIVGDPPMTVDVRVRGSSALLGRMEPGDVVALLDLEGARAGSRLFHLRVDEVRGPYGVEVAQITPSTVALELEKSDRRSVPVTPAVEGDPAPGYVLGRATATPAMVEVIGPESRLRDLASATTEPVSVAGQRASVTDVVTIGVSDTALRLAENQTATVVVEVLPAPVERDFAGVPVRWRNLGAGLSARIQPLAARVTIRGRLPALDAVRAETIDAFVDLAGLGPGQYNLRVQIDATQNFGVSATDPGAGGPADKAMSRLFGTDGVRGRAGEQPLDHETIARIGAAMVRVLAAEKGKPRRFLVGRDTRESGDWIARELARGVRSQGAQMVSAGVIPTPAVAYVTRALGFDAGLVISASHNPFEDNGIKVFSGLGEKFSEALEREVEAIVADDSWIVDGSADEPVPHTDVSEAYIAHTMRAFPEPHRLGRFRLAIDAANGATTTVAPRLFRDLGYDVELIGANPDGRNINLDVGSTHPGRLSARVIEKGCRMGVAFDGDGDRAIFVDANGAIVDGDAVLLMCARQMKAQGRLSGNAVVATVMSNIGLEMALGESGIDLVRTSVGDKYVMEEMLKRGLSLGGEQSGHIIFSDHLFTGDGVATALNVLRVMADTSLELADLASQLVTYPQVLVNVRVRERKDLSTVPEVADAMRRIEQRLSGNGRLLVRYSGTEPLLRIMIEGKDQRDIQTWAGEIASVVKQQLG